METNLEMKHINYNNHLPAQIQMFGHFSKIVGNIHRRIALKQKRFMKDLNSFKAQ
jgi:hypothetical protein